MISHSASDTPDGLPTRTTLSPSSRNLSARLSAPALLKAVARTLHRGERDRHWWTKPNAMEAAVVVLPVPVPSRAKRHEIGFIERVIILHSARAV